MTRKPFLEFLFLSFLKNVLSHLVTFLQVRVIDPISLTLIVQIKEFALCV